MKIWYYCTIACFALLITFDIKKVVLVSALSLDLPLVTTIWHAIFLPSSKNCSSADIWHHKWLRKTFHMLWYCGYSNTSFLFLRGKPGLKSSGTSCWGSEGGLGGGEACKLCRLFSKSKFIPILAWSCNVWYFADKFSGIGGLAWNSVIVKSTPASGSNSVLMVNGVVGREGALAGSTSSSWSGASGRWGLSAGLSQIWWGCRRGNCPFWSRVSGGGFWPGYWGKYWGGG